MNPTYHVPSGSGRRMMQIGHVEKSSPHNKNGFDTISPVKIKAI
jgi:hypothetical protein